MKSQITMRDLASHFGVSLNTVHKALAGKPGVGEETRNKIVEYAKEHGYKRNSLAANLKRKEVRIAVCLPELDEENRYFFSYIWQGCRAYYKEWEDLNFQIQEIPYSKHSLTDTLVALKKANETQVCLEGLLTSPPMDEAGEEAVNYLAKQGVSVVFVTEDNPKCHRTGVVLGDYYAAGQLMAEQTGNLIPKGGSILLLAGDSKKDAHCQGVEGFHEYMEQIPSDYRITDLYGYGREDLLEEKILDLLKRDTPDCICSTIARGSVKIFNALKKQNLEGKIPVIANDIFEENVKALREGLVTNLVFKNPHKQAYLAMKMLCDHIVRGIKPEESVCKVENILVFKNNLKYYWK